MKELRCKKKVLEELHKEVKEKEKKIVFCLKVLFLYNNTNIDRSDEAIYILKG